MSKISYTSNNKKQENNSKILAYLKKSSKSLNSLEASLIYKKFDDWEIELMCDFIEYFRNAGKKCYLYRQLFGFSANKRLNWQKRITLYTAIIKNYDVSLSTLQHAFKDGKDLGFIKEKFYNGNGNTYIFLDDHLTWFDIHNLPFYLEDSLALRQEKRDLDAQKLFETDLMEQIRQAPYNKTLSSMDCAGFAPNNSHKISGLEQFELRNKVGCSPPPISQGKPTFIYGSSKSDNQDKFIIHENKNIDFIRHDFLKKHLSFWEEKEYYTLTKYTEEVILNAKHFCHVKMTGLHKDKSAKAEDKKGYTKIKDAKKFFIWACNQFSDPMKRKRLEAQYARSKK